MNWRLIQRHSIKKVILIMVLAAFLLAACAGDGEWASFQSFSNGKAAAQVILVTPDPNATATPTAFQPVPNTATPRITATPTITYTPSPTPTFFTATPTVTNTATLAPLPDGTMNILLLGSDQRQDSGYRTDVIMLVSLHPQEGTVSVVSFPRDLYVTIPYWGMNRINTAMGLGGFNLLADTFETNFGVRPDHYVLTNFNGFISVVDALDGIHVEAAEPLSDKCDLPQADGQGICHVEPGTIHMDGETALWYARSRLSTSDFDRNRRAQEVVYAIFNRLLSLNALVRAPELYQQFRDAVETDMTLEDVLPFVPLAPLLSKPESIRRYTIGPGQVYDYVAEGGAWVLWPDQNAIMEIIIEAVYMP